MSRVLPLLVLLCATRVVSAAPVTPVITEPATDGKLVNGADVHMVTSSFSDPDGRAHLCTDWQITQGEDVVWEAICAKDAEKLHIHLADGVFTGPQARSHELAPGLTYRLAARHRNDSGDPTTEWSGWGERTFETSLPPASPPLSIRDVLASTEPRWTITPPSGASLRLEAVDEAPMLEIGATGATDAEALHTRSAVRVVLHAGPSDWSLPESELTFEDENGVAHTIYLPALTIAANAASDLWVSENGGTHQAEHGARTPDFTNILRGAPVPWSVRQRGFTVDVAASGLQLPVNIAFVPHPEDRPDAPLYYVAELYGAVKVVTRNGEVHDFADSLLDIQPTGHFPGNGESGIAGIAVDPESGDVLVTGVYWPDRSIWSLDPRVLRLHRSPDGLKAIAVETMKAWVGETQSPSHQISNITFGPDGKLYVHVGDSAEVENGQSMETIRGKVLRMNVDGTPASDNPFCNEADAQAASNYIYTLGHRNPFGGCWRASDESLYVVENGPAHDRFTRAVAGRNYLYDGTDESMANYALHTWNSAAPVQCAFVQPQTFGGSGFPEQKLDVAYVTETGPTWASGVQPAGKRITEIVVREDKEVSSQPLVEYDGTGKATASGIAAGPDGLYFTELYRDYGYASAIDRGARVFRVRWTGYAAFGVELASRDRKVVTFVDQSDVPGATAWSWDFGDGTSSSERNPKHAYAADGSYIVRLAVTGANGVLRETKKMFVGSSLATLSAQYFSDTDFQTPVVERSEQMIGFDWLSGSPDSSIPNDGFSARWTGTLLPRFSETYRFTARSNDRVRVTIGGALLIDEFADDHASETTKTIELEAGREYPIVVEYRHDRGEAALDVLWESDTQPLLHVPQSTHFVRRPAARH
jgi:glucose/arabinose dehydrogenase